MAGCRDGDSVDFAAASAGADANGNASGCCCGSGGSSTACNAPAGDGGPAAPTAFVPPGLCTAKAGNDGAAPFGFVAPRDGAGSAGCSAAATGRPASAVAVVSAWAKTGGAAGAAIGVQNGIRVALPIASAIGRLSGADAGSVGCCERGGCGRSGCVLTAESDAGGGMSSSTAGTSPLPSVGAAVPAAASAVLLATAAAMVIAGPYGSAPFMPTPAVSSNSGCCAGGASADGSGCGWTVDASGAGAAAAVPSCTVAALGFLEAPPSALARRNASSCTHAVQRSWCKTESGAARRSKGVLPRTPPAWHRTEGTWHGNHPEIPQNHLATTGLSQRLFAGCFAHGQITHGSNRLAEQREVIAGRRFLQA